MYLFGGTGPSTGVTVLNAVIETLFHDSTVYFALISGLLFSLVLQSRGWPAFWSNKLVNVISPYVVMTLLFTCLLRAKAGPRGGCARLVSR